MNLNEHEWSKRASNCFALTGLHTFGELGRTSIKELARYGNIGDTTLWEMLAACLKHHTVPAWASDVKLRLEFTTPDQVGETREEGKPFVVLAGPYGPGERAMLQMAAAQLGAINWAVVQDGDQFMLCRQRSGFMDVKPEEELL